MTSGEMFDLLEFGGMGVYGTDMSILGAYNVTFSNAK